MAIEPIIKGTVEKRLHDNALKLNELHSKAFIRRENFAWQITSAGADHQHERQGALLLYVDSV